MAEDSNGDKIVYVQTVMFRKEVDAIVNLTGETNVKDAFAAAARWYLKNKDKQED